MAGENRRGNPDPGNSLQSRFHYPRSRCSDFGLPWPRLCAGGPPRGCREAGSFRQFASKPVQPGRDLRRSGRQGSYFRSSEPSRCDWGFSDGLSALISRVRLASGRSAAEGSSQEGRFARIALSHTHEVQNRLPSVLPQPTVADSLTSPCVQSHLCSI
jgi:hypothetical protein